MQDKNQFFLGHRERIKEKFLKHKESLFDYELLELLLFYALPRKDVKPLAKKLINKFGSLRGVLRASHYDLMNIKGLNKHSIILIQLSFLLMQKVIEFEIQNKSIIKNWNQLLDHCFLKLSNSINEQFYVIYLNTKNFIIKDEILSEGSLNYATADLRNLMQKSLNLGAASILIAHNHPSGVLEPSKEDIKLTNELFKLAKALNIFLYDHLIISKTGIYSFRENSLIPLE